MNIHQKFNRILKKNGFRFDVKELSRLRDDGYAITSSNEVVDGEGNVYKYSNDREIIGHLALHGLIIVYC